MRNAHQKIFNLKNLYFAALGLEVAFGYFIYQSLRDNDKKILEEYHVNTSDYNGLLAFIAAFFAFSDVACNVSSIDPAQAAYDASIRTASHQIDASHNSQRIPVSVVVGNVITAGLGCLFFCRWILRLSKRVTRNCFTYIRWP